MKILTIGRGEDADIQLNQAEISRRHANIRYGMFGKMEIRDLSLNGTSINGRRLPPNKFVPVSRKDIVSFADVAKLDWKQVPDPMKPYKIGGIIVIAIIILFIVAGSISRIVSSCSSDKSSANEKFEQSDDYSTNNENSEGGTENSGKTADADMTESESVEQPKNDASVNSADNKGGLPGAPKATKSEKTSDNRKGKKGNATARKTDEVNEPVQPESTPASDKKVEEPEENNSFTQPM